MALGFLDALLEVGKSAAKYLPLAATVAGAALPLFMQQDRPTAPTTPVIQSAREQQALAAERAEEKRREIARRRGQAATIRTPLGVQSDIGVRQEGIYGL